MKVDFNAEKHLYTVDGAVFPSVTQILTSEGFIDPTWFNEYARQRGTFVHLCTHLDDTGELDESTVDPALAPYLSAYRRFKDESGFIASASEVPLVSIAYRFAGTPDKFGSFSNGTCALIDIETGSHQPAKAIQTAAYEILKGSPYRRFALQLKDDGHYKLHPFSDRQDKQIFLSALATFYWKSNNLRRAA